MTVTDAELMSVGPDERLAALTSGRGERVTTRVTGPRGPHEVTTEGPFHDARVTGLEPDTAYELEVEGAAPDGRWLPAEVRTLVQPRGRLLATVATANDVHFGETECGRTGDPATDAIGPILHSTPGAAPYPEVMNRAIVDEMLALDLDAAVVKGDLTDSGLLEQYDAFLACYGRLGPRLHHVRGNHDAMRDPAMARQDAPYAIALDGVTLAVLDTVVPGWIGGAVNADQRGWLDELAAATPDPVLVFA